VPEVNFLVKKGLTVPKASASTPAIIFDASDPNTGIYSPGADQVAISTNGTGRLFVDASGNVGVGAASPAYTLDVNGGVRQPNASFLYFNNSSGTAQPVLGLFSDNCTYLDAATGGSLIFRPNASQERARIDSSGRLGLGTTSPIGKLTVGNSSNSFLVSIDSSSSYAEIQAYNAPLYINRQGNDTIFNSGGGNVGIGTTSPSRLLHCSGTGGQEILLTALTSGDVRFGMDVVGSTYNWIDSERSSKALKFGVDNTERARIDSSGRLLVGTSSARVNYYNSAGIGSNFQVVGSTHAESSIILHNQAANAQGAYFHIGKSRGTAYEVVNNNDPLGVISFQGADGSTMREGANITAFVDGVPGASDLPTRLVFSTTADGASSPTERMRIKSNGTINFSNVATYADNAAATTGGLAVGDVYRTSTGQLMIRY